jgi:hypothetical protein
MFSSLGRDHDGPSRIPRRVGAGRITRGVDGYSPGDVSAQEEQE